MFRESSTSVSFDALKKEIESTNPSYRRRRQLWPFLFQVYPPTASNQTKQSIDRSLTNRYERFVVFCLSVSIERDRSHSNSD